MSVFDRCATGSRVLPLVRTRPVLCAARHGWPWFDGSRRCFTPRGRCTTGDEVSEALLLIDRVLEVGGSIRYRCDDALTDRVGYPSDTGALVLVSAEGRELAQVGFDWRRAVRVSLPLQGKRHGAGLRIQTRERAGKRYVTVRWSPLPNGRDRIERWLQEAR